MIHKRKHLWCRENFDRPFQGFGNAAVHRVLTQGMYLLWQDIFFSLWDSYAVGLQQANQVEGGDNEQQKAEDSYLQGVTKSLGVGLFAGTLSGFLLNGFSLVKYQMWARGEVSGARSPPGVMTFAWQMFREGGSKMFVRGLRTTVIRDAVFGITYEVLRYTPRHQKEQESFGEKILRDTVAGSVGSAVSSPINYVRGLEYAAPVSSSPAGRLFLVRQLVTESRGAVTPEAYGSVAHRALCRWRFLNERLNIGWGSLRVGVGMAVGQLAFRQISKAVAP